MSNILSALFEAQKLMPSIQKDSINPHFGNGYVSLDTVLDVILPVLHEQGILLIQSPTNVNGVPALRTTFVDVETGEKEEDTMMLVLERDNPQGQGSALTYAKRYALLSTLGLTADADDDGQKASTPTVRKKAAKKHDDEVVPSVPVF